MKFHHFTQASKFAIKLFISGNGACSESDPLQKKMKLCGYRIFLITTDSPEQDQLKEFASLGLPSLFCAWQAIRGEGMSNMAVQEAGWRVINRLGVAFCSKSGTKNPIIWRFRNNKAKDAFFILLSGNEHDGLPRYELLFLSNLWQVMNGSLPVHSSGVMHRDKLYLFAGHSGAGKTTIANIGKKIGDRILDEDQMRVHFKNQISADGWGFDVIPNEKPIQAVFKIIQDKADWIAPLKQSQLARLVMESSNQILGDMVPDDCFKRMFAMSSMLARHVPGFELHFRKSPDFWKLIDEQFPD